MRNLQTWTVLLVMAACVAADGARDGALAAQDRQIITVDSGQGMQIVGPGMMDPRQLKTGTGRIRGRIVSAETGTPVRRVQVRISGQNIAPKAMLTDTDGRYEFRDLPAGRFTIAANKAGYVNVQYGQNRPYEAGKPIELAEAQVLDKADITLPRGSVVAGRIIDEVGEPVTDAIVTAMRSVWSGGRRRLQPSGRTAQTNDLGQFRIFGLPPGDYYVSATFRGEMMLLEMVTATFTAGPANTATPTSGYAATYYPGTTNPSDAQRITLALGQEMQGADFALTPVKLVKVSGTVVRADGRPAEGAMVNLMPRTPDGGLFMERGGGRTDRNGAFTISGVTPGDYNLQVRGLQMSMTTSGDNVRVVMATRVDGGGAGGEEPEFGSAPVVVAGEDVTNVVIVTSKGGTAAGHVTFDGGTPPSTNNIRITAQSIDNEGPMMFFAPGPGGGAPGSIAQDGSFELRGLAGTRLIRASNLPAGWVLKSVRVEGQDVTDTGFDFKPGSALSGVEVVLTNKTTDITGTVTQGDGQPVKDFTAVIFAADPAKWSLPNSRYITGTRPDQEGRFRVRNLPPGDYLAIAVEYLAQGEWGDPEVLERLRGKATRFTLAEGAPKTLELKVQQH
jgi:protocatechuate 3,4-dioxygenase beta subunit